MKFRCEARSGHRPPSHSIIDIHGMSGGVIRVCSSEAAEPVGVMPGTPVGRQNLEGSTIGRSRAVAGDRLIFISLVAGGWRPTPFFVLRVGPQHPLPPSKYTKKYISIPLSRGSLNNVVVVFRRSVYFLSTWSSLFYQYLIGILPRYFCRLPNGTCLKCQPFLY